MQRTSQNLIKLLESHGWVVSRHKGSHVILKHEDYQELISVPEHGKQIKKGTYFAILKTAGLKSYID